MRHDFNLYLINAIGSILFVGDLRMEYAAMKAGDLVKFEMHEFGYWTHELSGKSAIYLGKNFLTRDDGVVVQNHKILLVGNQTPTIIDRSLLKFFKVIK